MLRSIGKQSRESVKSVAKKKRKAAVGRICRKRRFYDATMMLPTFAAERGRQSTAGID